MAHLAVQDIMTRNVVTIGLDATIVEARAMFERHGFHHLVVMEDNSRPLGVVSDRDILRHLSPFLDVPNAQREQDVRTLKKRMHQIMTRKLIAVPPIWSVLEAARLMLEHRVSCLPVITDDDQLVGILTMRDLVRWAVEKQN